MFIRSIAPSIAVEQKIWTFSSRSWCTDKELILILCLAKKVIQGSLYFVLLFEIFLMNIATSTSFRIYSTNRYIYPAHFYKLMLVNLLRMGYLATLCGSYPILKKGKNAYTSGLNVTMKRAGVHWEGTCSFDKTWLVFQSPVDCMHQIYDSFQLF